MRLRYTTPALADLEEILSYIEARSPRGAARVKERIQSFLELLARHPEMGARTDEDGIRRLVTSPHPYLVFYEATEEEIVIHAVRHAARDPRTMPGSA